MRRMDSQQNNTNSARAANGAASAETERMTAPPSFGGGDEGVANATRYGGGLQTQCCHCALCQSSCPATRDDRSGPFDDWRQVDHDRSEYGSARYECGRSGQGVEDVIDTGNVVGENFRKRGHTENRKRKGRPEPRKAVTKRDVTCIGCRAGYEHR
jgi:hypothetical protein